MLTCVYLCNENPSGKPTTDDGAWCHLMRRLLPASVRVLNATVGKIVNIIRHSRVTS